MDPYRACPKCGKEGLEPTWHSECQNYSNAKGIGKVKSKINRSGKLRRVMVNTSPEEHLHYFCKCKYDFIVLVRKEE